MIRAPAVGTRCRRELDQSFPRPPLVLLEHYAAEFELRVRDHLAHLGAFDRHALRRSEDSDSLPRRLAASAVSNAIIDSPLL